MEEYLSPSAKRSVDAAQRWAAQQTATEVDVTHLLLGIAEQDESRGASILDTFGLTMDWLRRNVAGNASSSCDGAVAPLPFSAAVRQVLSRARSRSVERGPDNPSGTDVLLSELLSFDQIQQLLAAAGADHKAIRATLDQDPEDQPLTVEFVHLELGGESDRESSAARHSGETTGAAEQPHHLDTVRILDACANRAREGLRVLEDYARFACDNRFLASELKILRHDLQAALSRLPVTDLLVARDAAHDVGMTYTTPGEWARAQPLDVVAANFKRAQESLRSLEEFGKIESQPFAESIEALRYRIYTLERAMCLELDSQTRLGHVCLYLLVSSDQCRTGLERTVQEALAGGVQAIQLREKSKPDRAVVEMGQLVRQYTREARALFIVNDRADIARTVGADGVHVGQTELPVREVRRIVGSHALVGVSTHSIEQARQAVLDGANYIGVGPTFPSATKSFDTFAGLELIRQVRCEIRLPAFAIGGIGLEQIDKVLAAGASRVAVSSAICAAGDPRAAATALRRRLSNCTLM